MAEFTIYPDGDGYLQSFEYAGTSTSDAFSSARSGVNMSENYTNALMQVKCTMLTFTAPDYYCYLLRSYMIFDTSVLGGEAVASVDLVLTSNNANNAPYNHYVVAFNPTTQTAPVGTDEWGNFGGTSFASFAVSGTPDTVYTASLSQDGIDEVDPNGDTFYGILDSNDFNNTNPNADYYHDMDYYASEETGTTRDPHLVVVTGGGGGTGFLAMF
jgi:hypothetical protein